MTGDRFGSVNRGDLNDLNSNSLHQHHSSTESKTRTKFPQVTTTYMAALTAPRLTYFAGWGLAEQLRWVLAAGSQTASFENVALVNFSSFSSLRSSGKLLLNQLPLLEIDGLNLTQSQSMIRYVASKNGHLGSSPSSSARADMIAEGAKDARLPIVKWAFSPDKTGHFKEMVEPAVARYYPLFESFIGAETGWTCGGDMTYADVLIAELAHGYMMMYESRGLPDPAEGYPKLKGLRGRVVEVAGVKEYLASDRRFQFPEEGEVCDAYVKNVREVLGR